MNFYTNLRAFNAGQSRWDNASPDEGPCACTDCGGEGEDEEGGKCLNCEGGGGIDADGEPCELEQR